MQPSNYSVGLEEELQLVDPDTGELRGTAAELTAGGHTRHGAPVFTSVADARRRLLEHRGRVARLAAERGLAVVAAGLNPVGAAREGKGAPTAPDRATAGFALRVRVTVPGREAAIRAMAGAAPYVPPLLALAAASPLQDGRPTGFRCYRTIRRAAAPHAGLPGPVATRAEYDRLVRILRGATAAGAGPPIAWDLGPGADGSTLEFRFMDACPWADLVGTLAASARALARLFADRPPQQRTGLELAILEENRWRAARDGLDASLLQMGPVTGGRTSARDAVGQLTERLRPLAVRMGDGDVISGIDTVLARGDAAGVMADVYHRSGSARAVVQWLVEETAAGADASRR